MLSSRRRAISFAQRSNDVSGHWARTVPHGLAEARSNAVERSRGRLSVLTAGIIIGFASLAWRLGELSFYPPTETRLSDNRPALALRTDVLDRDGALIARDVATFDISIDPSTLDAPEATASAIAFALPQIDPADLTRRFGASKHFAYVLRDASPRDAEQLHGLGLPGITYKRVAQRAYPKAELFSHVLGYVDTDNKGLSGIELALDRGQVAPQHDGMPLTLSLDTDIQFAVREELSAGLRDYGALAAVGIVIEVATGEIWSMVSLPDFNPNLPGSALENLRKNRAAGAVYEFGSVFKSFTFALALDRQDISLGERLDARKPLKIGGWTITDYHAQRRVMTALEVYLHSSNIGTAQIALKAGAEAQRVFLDRLGLLSAAPIEIFESTKPLVRDRWSTIDVATISYGHGISVTPVQLAAASAAIVNGGYYIAPTLIKRAPGELPAKRHVIKETTSGQIRALMRANVVEGTGFGADVRGLDVGGKTGTAEKPSGGGYDRNRSLATFVSVFPARAPQFVMVVMLDEPTIVPGNTLAPPTAGATAAPLSGRIISRIAPMMGISSEPASSGLQDVAFMRSH